MRPRLRLRLRPRLRLRSRLRLRLLCLFRRRAQDCLHNGVHKSLIHRDLSINVLNQLLQFSAEIALVVVNSDPLAFLVGRDLGVKFPHGVPSFVLAHGDFVQLAEKFVRRIRSLKLFRRIRSFVPVWVEF